MLTLLADLKRSSTTTAPRALSADATPPAWNGYRLIVACGCVATFERWVTPQDANWICCGPRAWT